MAERATERDGFPTKRDAYERAVIALDMLDAIDAKGPQDEAAERWFRRRLRGASTDEQIANFVREHARCGTLVADRTIEDRYLFVGCLRCDTRVQLDELTAASTDAPTEERERRRCVRCSRTAVAHHLCERCLDLHREAVKDRAPTEEREHYSATVGKEISKPVEDEVDDRMEWEPEFSEECLTDTLEHLEGGAPLKNVWHWPATGISRAAVRDALLTGIMLARRLRATPDEAPEREGSELAEFSTDDLAEMLELHIRRVGLLVDEAARRLRQPEPAREGEGDLR